MLPSNRKGAADGKEGRGETVTAPGEEPRPSKRRRRTKYEPRQVDLLKASFAWDPYPSIQELQRLENLLGIREDRLSVWFQNRRTRHLRSVDTSPGEQSNTKSRKNTKCVALQGQQRATLPPAGAPTEEPAGPPSWPGNGWDHPQLGQYQPACQYYQQQHFQLGSACQPGSSPFGMGQATCSLPSNVSFGPSVQSLLVHFGGAEDQSQPQQSRQNSASWSSYFDYNSHSVQHQESARPVNTSGLVDIMSYTEGDCSYAQSSSSGNSSCLYGGEAARKGEPSPKGTYINSHSSPYSSSAQWPGSSQWGILPKQSSPTNGQGYQDGEMALANVTNREESK